MFFTFDLLATCVSCNSWVTVSSMSPVLVLSSNVIICTGMLAIHTIIRRWRHVICFPRFISSPLYATYSWLPSLHHSYYPLFSWGLSTEYTTIQWMLNGLMTDLPVVCLFQNLVLPECFYSFVDVRKEFHKCCPNAGQVQDLTLHSMLECKSESDEI